MSMRNAVFQLQQIKNRVFTEPHYQIHEGNSYNVTIDNESMGSGDLLALGFKTGTGECHMVIGVTSKDAAKLYLYEDATWSGGQTGTQVQIQNRNRRSSNMSNLYDDWRASGVWESSGMVKIGMTGVIGTNIHHLHMFGAKAWEHQQSRGSAEFILDTGTQYAVVLEALVATNAGHVTLNWYEI